MLAVNNETEFEIDVRSAELLRDIRHALPHKPTVRCLKRWINHGLLNRYTRERIRLPAIHTPRGRATTVAAYEWMIRRLNDRE